MSRAGAPAPYPDGWLDGEADAIARAAGLRADALAVVDLTQAEFATVALAQRVRSSLGRTIEAQCRDGAHFVGRLSDSGNGWVLLGELAAPRASAVLVPVAAITQFSGLSRHVKDVDAAVSRSAGIGAVLRGWIESRERVRCGLIHGVVEGTIARVGKDALDVATHPLDRGPTLVDPVAVIPMPALNWVVASH